MDEGATVTWEDSFSLAMMLRRLYPEVRLEDISLGMIYRWVIELAEFDDDPQLVNDDILMEIYKEWYEEVNPI